MHDATSDILPRVRTLLTTLPVPYPLFRSIAKGELIGFYTGEVLSGQELDARYPDFEGSEYVMQIAPDTYLDAKDPEKSSFTRCGLTKVL